MDAELARTFLTVVTGGSFISAVRHAVAKPKATIRGSKAPPKRSKSALVRCACRA
jgi:hypothetical protein